MIADVAQKVGWHEDWPDGYSPYRVWFDAEGNRRDGYTSDVLAEWLAGEALFLAEIMRSNGEWFVTMVNTDTGLDPGTFCGLTLLGALEQAVLAT